MWKGKTENIREISPLREMLEEEPFGRRRKGSAVTGDCFVGMRKGLKDLKQHGFIS